MTMPPEIVVHDLEQARAVLRSAGDWAVKVQLRSAPGAAAYAGVGYLHALGEASGQMLLIDCGDDAGLTMAAMRAGCRKLEFSGSDDLHSRLQQMVELLGGRVHGPACPPPPRLVLSPDDDGDVRTWLTAKAKHRAGVE